MPRRAGVSSSDLDSVIPTTPAPATSNRTAAPATNAENTRKEKIAGYVPADLADTARNAVAALGNHIDDPQSLSELIENAVRREITRLQTERNNGQPFPHRARRNLPVGRRPE